MRWCYARPLPSDLEGAVLVAEGKFWIILNPGLDPSPDLNSEWVGRLRRPGSQGKGLLLLVPRTSVNNSAPPGF